MMAISLVLYIIVLAAATFIEKGYSTATAKSLIYNNPLFFVLNALMVVNFIAMSIKGRMIGNRRWGVLVLHWGFVVVLVGAMVTYVFGREGIVHIREGETSNTLLDNMGQPLERLPFSITLDDFKLERYSGSMSPSSFESFLTIDGEKYHAYMNNVVHYGAYRIYQSSYDQDEGGSVLSVNRDRIGTLITYFGYFLLTIGFLWAALGKKSRFRALLRSLGVVALMLGFSEHSWAQDQTHGHGHAHAQGQNQTPPASLESLAAQAQKYIELYKAPDSIAHKFASLRVQSHKGRVEPIDTYARELVRKMNGDNSIGTLSPSAALMGWISQPELWSYVPMIEVSSDRLLSEIGFRGEGELISFMDLIDPNGAYKLDSMVQASYALPPNQRNKFDKEIIKVDEKINILNAIFQGEMLPIFPLASDPAGDWYSSVSPDFAAAVAGTTDSTALQLMPMLVGQINNASLSGDWGDVGRVLHILDLYQQRRASGEGFSQERIDTEMLYNRLQIFKWNGFGYMTLGLLLIISTIISLVTGRRLKGLFIALILLSVVMFLAQNAAMGMRWYISGRAPWTNAYETMVYVGWASMFGGLLFMRRSRMTFALATFLAGVILFVTNLSWMDPQITPLVPVLKSAWLVSHVGVITASYGFFGIAFLLGVTTMILMLLGKKEALNKQIHELVTINELALWIGLALMSVGTFLGAIWANESWGRYWGWDPKETWALITMIVYTFVLHARFVRGFRGAYSFSLMAVVALGSVLMTFFGVNYYLSGMHSYGGDSAPPALNIIWIVYALIGVLALFAYRKSKNI